MATTFGQRQAAIDEIVLRLKNNGNRLSGAKQAIAQAKADLDAIPTQLKIFLDEIAADSNRSTAYGVMADQAMILLNESQALSQAADSYTKALDALE